MRNRTIETAIGAALFVLLPGSAKGRPPADDFLNPVEPGARLTLMPFVGPGFRANYDHRFELEADVTELRAQLIGTVAFPFAEASANLDVRLFLMSFGASAGYHDEWHVLRFDPDPATGMDSAGDLGAPGTVQADPTPRFSDLSRAARVVKDANSDYEQAAWAFYEARWGFVWPAQNFMGVSTLAARHDGRPDVTYDWEQATVLDGGWHLRWEGYALVRSRNLGFAGLALRAMYVPRNRVRGPVAIPASGLVVPDGSACQADNADVLCVRTYEASFYYGLLAGLRPNWIEDGDLLLVRAYAAYGLGDELFGLHTFRQPLQVLVAYMADIEL